MSKITKKKLYQSLWQPLWNEKEELNDTFNVKLMVAPLFLSIVSNFIAL
jgi:hypothetical protein